MLLSSDSIKNSSNTVTMKKIIMHFVSKILFLIERKEKEVLIVRSKDLVCNECALEMKTMNDLNFIKFINLTKTEFDFDSNDKNIIYRLNTDDLVKIINDRQWKSTLFEIMGTNFSRFRFFIVS